jgi:hypothetical protein
LRTAKGNDRIKNQLEQGAVFLGRDLMALLILGGAMQKANDPMPVMALIAGVQVRGVVLLAVEYGLPQVCFIICPMIHSR